MEVVDKKPLTSDEVIQYLLKSKEEAIKEMNEFYNSKEFKIALDKLRESTKRKILK